MNDEKTLSLRDALSNGFDRVAAEEAAGEFVAGDYQEPMESATEEIPAEGMAQEEVPEQESQHTAPAEVPTQMAAPAQNTAQPDMMAVIMQTITALREENAQLRSAAQQSTAALEQQSRAAEEAAVNAVAQPQIPALNFKELQYMGDEEAAAALTAWQNAVIEGAAQKSMQTADAKYARILKDFEDRQRMAETESARNTISARPEFSDFAANSSEIERIAAFPEFQSMAPQKRYMFAALAARGMHHNPNTKPSTDEIVQMAVNNPDVMKALETRRAQNVQRTNSSLPVLTASSGMGGASAVPENHVKSREDLESRMRARFGLK